MNKCPTCKTENGTYKFGKLYQCEKCKSHFYGEAPTKQEKERSVEEIVFEERIQERNKRREVSSIEAEILKLAAEARAEMETKETEDNEPIEGYIPMKSAGRPRKAK